MAFNLKKRVFEYVQAKAGQAVPAREIAQWIFDNYPQECAEKKHSSTVLETDAQLMQQIVAEIAASRPRWQQQHAQLKTTQTRPREYYWSEMDASAEVEAIEGTAAVPPKVGSTRLVEHNLYPKLSEYLFAELSVHSMRIDEKRSSNRAGSGGNEWLHPDLVGLEDLSGEWTRELRECVGVMAERRTRLWSFEVKLLLNRSNVRKSYFQAVSNSSWAHFGYLVAAMIEGDETMKELRMLSATHGVGLIRLDPETPIESEIMIPARERAEIDWDMCNRLAEENPDFVSFIGKLRRFHQTGEVNPNDWVGSSQV